MRADRWTDRVESEDPSFGVGNGDSEYSANDSLRLSPSSYRRRLSAGQLQLLGQELSQRDWAILRDLRRVRVLSGRQIEALHFQTVASSSRGRIRRRVLSRIQSDHLLVTLERRIGGVRAGSAGLVYALSAAGQRLLDLDDANGTETKRRQAPHTPGAAFLAHALAVAEVYVQLSEQAGARRSPRLVDYLVEGEAAWPSTGPHGQSELLRPDALAIVAAGSIEDIWWIEIDRSTESLPRLRSKLERYRRFARSGQPGPRGVVPRVLVSVPDDRRLRAVRSLLDALRAPAGFLQVVQEGEVAGYLLDELQSGEIEKPP